MSYTCPDCYWISQNPNDLAHLYCGRCREFKGTAFHPSPFQAKLIIALLGRSPMDGMMLEVAAFRLEGVGLDERAWDAALLEIMPLWGAQRLTQDQYMALSRTTRKVAEMTRIFE